MANDGFIEILSPNALAELKQAEIIVKALANDIEKISKFKAPTSPSGADASSKQHIADLKAQEQAIKQATNALIQEEKVKQAGINTQIKANAEKKSAISLAEKEAMSVKKLGDAYTQLKKRSDDAGRSVQNLIIRGKLAGQTQKQYNDEIRRAQKEFTTLNGKIKQADQAIGKFSLSSLTAKSALSGVSNLMGAFGIATGLYLAVDIVKNIFNTTKELQSLDLALKNVSGSQEAFTDNQGFLGQLANQYGIEIKGLTKNFTDFLAASKGLLSQTQIEDIFTSVSKSAAAMGLSVESTDSAFLALEQMMSKGTIQAEELKKQLGNALPGAMRAAAMAYMELHPEITKVADAERILMQEMKKGAIDSATYIPLIVKQFEKLYGIENITGINTLQSSVNRLSNAWVDMIRSMNESETGAISNFFSWFTTGLTNGLNLLVRWNDEWETLNKKARAVGKETGEDFYKTTNKSTADLIEDERKFTNEIERIKSVLVKLKKEFSEEGFFSEINPFSDTGGDIEKLYGELGQLEGALKKIQNKLNPKELIKPEDKGKTESAIKERERIAKEAAQADEKRRKDAYDLEISDLKRKIEISKDLFNIKEELNKEELSYFAEGVAKKLSLSMKLATLELELAQRVAKEKKRLAQGNKALGIAPTIGGDNVAQNEYNTESENIALDHTNRMDKINQDYFKSMQDAVPSDWSSKTPTMWTPEQIKQAEDDAKKIIEIQNRLKEEFRNYIQSFGQDFFSNAGFGETFDFFVRMDENGKTMFDKLGELADGSVEKFAATFQAISESAQEAFNFISEASQRSFDAEYARLEEQKDIALLFAGESASAREEIERQYEQKRKGIAQREAKAKQRQAIFNIAIDTAQAIVAAVAKSPLTFGLPWSAVAAAIGAAKIAVVASQQIPQFWKGTDDAPEGMAYTQEKGREIITDKQGRIKSLGSDKGAQLTYLNKGDKVFKNSDTEAMLFNSNLNNMLMSKGISNPNVNINKVEIDTNGIIDAINNKVGFELTYDENGINKYKKEQGQRVKLLNNRLRTKGYDI